MKKQTQTYIGIFALIVLGVGIFLAGKSDNNPPSANISVPQEHLTPEKEITHGHGLAVDVNDPSKLYIATHHGLLVLLNDKELYRIGKSKDDLMGFSSHSSDPNMFFSSGHPSMGGNIGFQRSSDGGVTWEKVSLGIDGPVDFHTMTASLVNPSIIYGWYRGNIQRSQDFGKTWEIVNRDILAVSLAADSQDEQTVYAATPNGRGVLVSRNKGVSWTSLTKELEGGQVSVVTVHPGDAGIIFAFAEKLGGLGKSTDGGKTWKRINETFAGETVLHIALSKMNPNIMYALTHENKLFKSTDIGETWKRIR